MSKRAGVSPGAGLFGQHDMVGVAHWCNKGETQLDLPPYGQWRQCDSDAGARRQTDEVGELGQNQYASVRNNECPGLSLRDQGITWVKVSHVILAEIE